MRICKCYGNKLLLKELKGSYNFFIKEANVKIGSKGFGLIKDKTELAFSVVPDIYDSFSRQRKDYEQIKDLI